MDRTFPEPRFFKVEDGVANISPCQNENPSVIVKHLHVRICRLEAEVARQRLQTAAYITLIRNFKSAIGSMKSTIRRMSYTNRFGDSQAKKKKVSSKSTYESKGFNVGDAVKVYTDGSCYNNGRHNASAGIGVYWGPNSKDNISERLPGRQTNNRAEIYAAIRAVEQAIQKDIKNLMIHTDSMFLINCMNNWIHQWKKNGWLKVGGGKVINKEELLQLDTLLENINVKWVYVNGHCGIPGNEAADKLAVTGSGCGKKLGKQLKKTSKKGGKRRQRRQQQKRDCNRDEL